MHKLSDRIASQFRSHRLVLVVISTILRPIRNRFRVHKGEDSGFIMAAKRIHRLLIRLTNLIENGPIGETQCACTTVKKLSRVLGRVYDLKVTPVGLNITQHAVLRCLSRRSGEPLVRIAEELEMDRTSLYRALTPMIRDGWVTSPSATGRRFRTAKLTQAGRRILKTANQKWDDVQNALISRFGQASYDSLLAELYRLADCAADVSED